LCPPRATFEEFFPLTNFLAFVGAGADLLANAGSFGDAGANDGASDVDRLKQKNWIVVSPDSYDFK
jgi:hypothetical protein